MFDEKENTPVFSKKTKAEGGKPSGPLQTPQNSIDNFNMQILQIAKFSNTTKAESTGNKRTL